MQVNTEALKALKLKLAEYNGAIAEYASSNMNRICYNCNSSCSGTCKMLCDNGNCDRPRRPRSSDVTELKKVETKVNFTGKIDEGNVRLFINEIKDIFEKTSEISSLTIYISSPGGNVDIAIELFNFLKLLDCKVKTVNTSYVNSAAIIVFVAGEERICLPCSSFYVHSITKNLNGDFTANDLLREAKEMITNADKVAEILAHTGNKNKSYWKRLMRKGCLLTSQKAKELGLISDISEYE